MHPSLSIFDIQINLYPVFMGAAWAIAYILIKEQLRKNNWQLPGLETLFLKVFVFSWIGSKIAYYITMKTMNVSDFFSFGFWFGGGLVFYGGFLFGGGHIAYRIFKKTIHPQAYYTFIPAIAIAHGIGRIGCFLAGCCYGTHCELPWGIDLHNDLRHPVQLYEAICLISYGFWTLRLVLRKKIKNLPIHYIGFYALLRFVLEFFRGDGYRGVYMGISFSQWVALIIILIVSSYLGIKHLDKLKSHGAK